MSTVDELDVVAECERVEREHEVALAHYRWCESAENAAVHHNVLIPRDAKVSDRRIRADARPRGRELDPLERDLEIARLRSEKAEAIQTLLAARDRLAATRVARAQHAMPSLVDLCDDTSTQVERERAYLEVAYVELVARAIKMNEAAARHVAARRRLREVVLAGAPNQEVRQGLADTFEAGQYPTALTDNGTPAATTDAPERNLFGLGADRWRPGTQAFGEEVADLTNGGSRQLAATAERVERRIRRRLAEIDNS